MLSRLRDFFWKIPEKSSKPVNIIASSDGKLYEMRTHLMGDFILETNYIKELDKVEPGFSFRLPKIPADVLKQILAFFRSYCNEWEQNEVMVIIYWDLHEKAYHVTCPKQKVSKYRIFVDEYEAKYLNGPNKRYEPIMHIHSHNSMGAHFSSIDDENEKALMLYAVVGNMLKRPEIKIRAGANGNYVPATLEDVFELPKTFSCDDSFPLHWAENVEIIGGEK